MGRAPCCDKQGLKKGPWTPDEDQKLVEYIQRHGHGSWRALPKHAGLLRCGKSCRLRWTNYLRPDIKRGRFSLEEDQLIIQLHAMLGNKWSAIAAHLPGRTDNEIKNYWNTHLKKRLLHMGIDPVTHKATQSPPLLCSKLSHLAQWDSARLEAEARLARRTSPDWLLNSWRPQQHSSSSSSSDAVLRAAAGADISVLPPIPPSLAHPRWDALAQPMHHPSPYLDITTRNGSSSGSAPPPGVDFDSAGAALLLNHISAITAPPSAAQQPTTVPMEEMLSPTSTLRVYDATQDSGYSSPDSLVSSEALMQQCERMIHSSAAQPPISSFPALVGDVPMFVGAGFGDDGTTTSAQVAAVAAAAAGSSSFWQPHGHTQIHHPEQQHHSQQEIQQQQHLGMVNLDMPIQCESDAPSCHSLSEDESSGSYGPLQLPPDMLLDLVDVSMVAHHKSEADAAGNVNWGAAGDAAAQLASKDYWSNMLKLVGPPLSEAPVAVMER